MQGKNSVGNLLPILYVVSSLRKDRALTNSSTEVGSCSCVSIVGATLQGGVGPYGGLHAL